MRDDGRPDSAPARDEDDIDYYDWKARYRGWAGIGMMRPALVAAGPSYPGGRRAFRAASGQAAPDL